MSKPLTIPQAHQTACDGHDRLKNLLFQGYFESGAKEAIKETVNDFSEIMKTLEAQLP